MKFLFWLLLILDSFALFISLYETFAVSSNRSIGTMVFICMVLLACIVFALWFKTSHPERALLIIALPFIAIIIYVLFMFIGGMRNNWR